MFLILVLTSSALIVCLGVIFRRHHNQCAVCGKHVSKFATTCSPKCRQIRHRNRLSHRRDKVVTPVFRSQHTPVTGRGEEPEIFIDGRKVS